MKSNHTSAIIFFRKLKMQQAKSSKKSQILVKINKIILATASNTILAELNSKINPNFSFPSANFLTAALAALNLSDPSYSEGPLKFTTIHLFGREVKTALI